LRVANLDTQIDFYRAAFRVLTTELQGQNPNKPRVSTTNMLLASKNGTAIATLSSNGFTTA
jgi:hypothetical protein